MDSLHTKVLKTFGGRKRKRKMGWRRQCEVCGSSPAPRTCGSCGAIRYCSLPHQHLHWEQHKTECSRMAKQMERGALLHDFPFTFAQESTRKIDIGEITSCEFFERRGVHRIGLWKAECDCAYDKCSILGWGLALTQILFENPSIDTGWCLPSVLCPCTEASNCDAPLQSWADYYQWRRLPLDSLVAILLHWPLSIYFSLNQLRKLMPNFAHTGKPLRVHYLGPERELDQLEVFVELSTLLTSDLEIHFVGPAVPDSRDGETLELRDFAKCCDAACQCNMKTIQDPVTKSLNNIRITTRLWKGCYHDVYEELSKTSFPDLVFAANAGIAVFSSWIPTIKLIHSIGTPMIFTDFCEEAALMASSLLEEVLKTPISIPVQPNPFRQPLTPSDKLLELPTYSNAFMFGMV